MRFIIFMNNWIMYVQSYYVNRSVFILYGYKAGFINKLFINVQGPSCYYNGIEITSVSILSVLLKCKSNMVKCKVFIC